MKVLLLTKNTKEEKEEILRKLDSSAEVVFAQDLDEKERKEAIKTAEIIFGGKLSNEELELTENLKMHQTFATGVDRHNKEYYKNKGIILCNSHVHSDIIAEYAFSLLIASSKEIVANDKLLRKEGLWNYTKHPSVTLFNKNILFLGFGQIARKVKELFVPFKMNYFAIKRTPECDDSEVKVFLPDEKLEVLKKADFIINTLPLTEKTKDFLNTTEFEVMKPTAIIVNVGRGLTINEEALFTALKERKIKGAAIDVWYNYPKRRGENQDPIPCYPSSFPFQELDNVIMSAHRAWQTDKPWFENTLKLIENINRFL
ncbi:MAG: NAD(P)-dependent oxidoreductase, partial [Candidatus Heimdallarchaeaceae archaeon]